MEQTKALNALEPFLALTKSATTPRQAADLIDRATSAPNTYLFAELLAAPQIQALRTSADYSSHLALLNIFSHGTYSTYLTTPNLPALSAPQTLKLRQLSLLTLARDRTLSYPSLLSSLGLSSAAELEDLVTSAIYASLVRATLDPARQTVHIHSVSPLRDVAPDSVPALLWSLRAWSSRCESALADLTSRVTAIRTAADARARAREEREGRVRKLVEDESKSGATGHTVGGGFGGDAAVSGGSSTQQDWFASGGGGSSSQGLPSRGGQTLGGGHGSSQAASSRYGKRGSGHMDGAAGADIDDEAMDLDEVDDEKKRTSRRKL